MSGPNYSNGVLGTFTLDSSDVQNFFDDVRSALLNSRWTVVKTIPSDSGTVGYQFKSVATTALNQILLNMFWDGSRMVLVGYPIIKFTIDTVDETHTTDAGTVTITIAKKNRIICGPYQFFIFFDSTVSPNANLDGPFDRNNATGGMPVRKIESGSAFWTMGDLNSWRYNLYRDEHISGNSSLGFLYNGIWKTGRNPGVVINPQLLSLRSTRLIEPTKFFDNNFPVINPELVLGVQPNPVVLSLWDAIVVVGGFYNSKVTTLADFRDWESFTIQGTSDVCVGCLFLAIKSYASSAVGSYSH